jgi:hypothetical protein
MTARHYGRLSRLKKQSGGIPMRRGGRTVVNFRRRIRPKKPEVCLILDAIW